MPSRDNTLDHLSRAQSGTLALQIVALSLHYDQTLLPRKPKHNSSSPPLPGLGRLPALTRLSGGG